MANNEWQPEVKLRHPSIEMDIEITPSEDGKRNFVHIFVQRDGRAKIAHNTVAITVPNLKSFIEALTLAREAAQKEIGYLG